MNEPHRGASEPLGRAYPFRCRGFQVPCGCPGEGFDVAIRLTLEDYEVEGAVANDVYALYLPTRYLSPKVRAFIDFFVEYFSRERDR